MVISSSGPCVMLARLPLWFFSPPRGPRAKQLVRSRRVQDNRVTAGREAVWASLERQGKQRGATYFRRHLKNLVGPQQAVNHTVMPEGLGTHKHRCLTRSKLCTCNPAQARPPGPATSLAL